VIVALFALVWLLLVRPQRKRSLEQRELLTSLEPGDEIVSTGGLFGVIRSVDGEELRVEIADGLVVRMARRAVAGLVEREEEPESEAESESPQTTVESPDELTESPHSGDGSTDGAPKPS
jgi:preprotein translocase subunit YajC